MMGSYDFDFKESYLPEDTTDLNEDAAESWYGIGRDASLFADMRRREREYRKHSKMFATEDPLHDK